MKTKMLLILLFLILAGGAEAQAGSITMTLDAPSQGGSPGSTLHFFGTIENTGTADIFLNADSLNLAGTGFNVTDFLIYVPLFLSPGASSGSIELFEVEILNPFSDPFTSYLGTYTLLGGDDEFAQDTLGDVNFSVTPVLTPVPEPNIALLLFAGLPALAAFQYRVKETRRY